MEKPIKLAVDEVLKMRERAAHVPVPEPTEVSRQGAIAMMAPVLRDMHERGHTWPAIVKWLKGQGLTIGKSALQRVISKAAAKERSGPGAPRGAKPRSNPHAITSGAAKTALLEPPPAAPEVFAVPSATRLPETPSRSPVAPAPPSAVAATRAAPTVPTSAPTATPKGTFVMRPDTPDL